MTLKSDVKFEEKLIFCLKNDKHLENVDRSTHHSQNVDLIVSFCEKYITFDLKKSRGVIFHDTEGWCQIWRKTDLWFGKWLEEFRKFLPEDSKVSVMGPWWDPFIQSRKCMRFKFTEELCIMKMKNDIKFEEELTCLFKIDTTIWRILTRALGYLKKLYFNGLLLTKLDDVWAKKVQKRYLWWHWRLMQNLKENLLVLSKMTRGIWKTFTGWKK